MNRRDAVLMSFACFVVAHSSSAQTTPLDFRASIPILDSVGAVLPGTLTNFGCANAPGGVVQVLQVGTGGVAHLPNLDGTPSGADSVLFTTAIGDYNGLDPCALGHQLDTSFTPRPANGTKIFARVFDAASIAAATHWGQSATFSVNGSVVFDVNAAGLKATTMPKGSDPNTTDSDGDGQTDFQELVGNTNPLNPHDRFEIAAITSSSSINIAARAGRTYTLQRATDLSAPNPWTDATATGPLSADTNLTLTDPAPPASTKVFYRIKVSMP